MLRRLSWFVILAVVLGTTGCDSGPKKKGEKNAATAQWKAARAAVMITLARDQFNGGNFDGARGTVGDALRILPESADLRVLSARIAIEQGNLDLAESELRLAQQYDPANPAADYYYGVIMQRWQRLPKALELYTAAFNKNPREIAYLTARAETLVALEKEDEAVQLLTKACTEFENSAEVRAALGQVYLRQRRYTEAADILRQAVMLQPEDETQREQLARAYFNARRLPEATETLERLLKSEKYAKRADLFTLLGECLLAADRPRDARAAFETASNLQPQSVPYLLNLAKASLESGDTRRTEMVVRKALAIQPNDPQANLLLGYVRMEQNKYAEALAAFRRAEAADPTLNDTVAICMTGVALEKLGRRDEAAREYARALELKPNDDLARRLLNQVGTVTEVETNR